jgi:general secretion pathway protein K
MRSRTSTRGFVLPATLIALAIATVAIAYFFDRANAALRVAQARAAAVDARLGMLDTQAEILYTLATTYAVPRGSQVGAVTLYMDDRTYRGERDTRVALQDAAGLFSLNAFTDESMTRLLRAFGTPNDQIPVLIDTLKDYIDPDNAKRLNGAEAFEYEAAGMPPPRNEPLRVPYEVRNILGWSSRRALWGSRSFEAATSTAQVAGLNANTAPPQVLQAMLAITPEGAARLLALRDSLVIGERQVIDVGGQFSHFTGLPLIASPAPSVRITQWAPAARVRVRQLVTMTPLSPAAPWRVDYQYRIASPEAEFPIVETETPQLPLRRADAPAPAPLAPFLGPPGGS